MKSSMAAKRFLIHAVYLGHFVPFMENSLLETRVPIVRLLLVYSPSLFLCSVTTSGLLKKDRICLNKGNVPFQACQPISHLDLMASHRSYTENSGVDEEAAQFGPRNKRLQLQTSVTKPLQWRHEALSLLGITSALLHACYGK